MKLIIVDRGKTATFERLADKWADDPNVRVVWDRRRGDRRRTATERGSDLRWKSRRALTRPYEGFDYIVVHVEE